MASTTQVPVVAYHSIANEHDHQVRHLSLPLAIFERQLQYLQRKGFETVTLYDVHRFLAEGARLPPRAIALTFDDGYLDNWVHAFPLLKKYGMKATIFVATDFIDPAMESRPTLEDAWAGRVAERDLTWWGYVSWPELESMQASGIIDVQAHTKTHAWYFASDRIVDFHHPADSYFWLDWNARPEAKHGWLTRDFRATVPWGTPVYEFASTLLRQRYFDDPQVAQCVTTYVSDAGGRDFFTRPQWRRELDGVVARHRARVGLRGRYETDDQYVIRVKDEMAGSRRILAERLKKPVDFLCWPCGDYTPRLQRLATQECGYLATVNVNKTSNRRGDDPSELRRIVFGQDYAGPWRESLVFMNFCGNVNYYSGRLHAYPPAPVARRVMRLGRLLSRRRPRKPAHA
jgi:Polysaccharide deacetylase